MNKHNAAQFEHVVKQLTEVKLPLSDCHAHVRLFATFPLQVHRFLPSALVTFSAQICDLSLRHVTVLLLLEKFG